MTPGPTDGLIGRATLLLLVSAMAAGAQSTSYRAEIASRQSRLHAIAAELRVLEEKISNREGQIRDFLVMHERIETLAAEAGRRPAVPIDNMAGVLAAERRTPGSEAALDPTGRMAAEASVLLHPSRHPIRSDKEAAAVRQWQGAFPTSAFTFRSGEELVQAYEMLRGKFSSGEAPLPLGDYYKRRCLIEERGRLEREIAALQHGENDAAAAAAILGRWRLATQNNGSIVEVIRNPNTGAFAGVLRDCRLQHFSPNATVFVVEPAPDKGGAFFSGREFGYSNDGLPAISPLTLSIAGETMTYRTPGETLQWQRFVPWGDRRATLGQPPPDAGFEAFENF